MIGSLGRPMIGLFFWAVLAAGMGSVRGQGQPAATAPATQAATGEATHRPSAEELLPKNTATFDFEDVSLPDLIGYIEKSYGLKINNECKLTDHVTLHLAEPLKASQAISLLSQTLSPLGYTVLETVHDDPPALSLTVVATKRNAGAKVPVFRGSDPADIPENDEIRMQVITLVRLDPKKAADTVSAILHQPADISIYEPTKTLTITDTGSRIHAAAALLQILEKQAADANK